MIYVQINSFYNGSTGALMRRLHSELTEQGVDSYIFWGRRGETLSRHEQCMASRVGYLTHGLGVRLSDRMGFYSRKDTAKLLEQLDRIDPDVVHLHNVHGYYLNIELLFAWLASHRCRVIWTLHDCWAFTGHCAHFSYVGCDQWRVQCAMDEPCPQLAEYPRTITGRNCSRNFIDKQRIFCQIPVERMLLITPSEWLASLVKQSFLSKYQVQVVNNRVDRAVFKPRDSDFREKFGIGERFMVLGVASPWTNRKGLAVFHKLSAHLPNDRVAIVLVGLTATQIEALPPGVIGLSRTGSAVALSEIYSAADLFVNPTFEDNYPTVNLEAEACGTPVLTFDSGGSAETIRRVDSTAVSTGDIDGLLNEIRSRSGLAF